MHTPAWQLMHAMAAWLDVFIIIPFMVKHVQLRNENIMWWNSNCSCDHAAAVRCVLWDRVVINEVEQNYPVAWDSKYCDQ